jgi:putative spermidine/putrescine transport system permease protein
MTVGALARGRKGGRVGRIQALLWRRPWMRAALLLGPGLTWFVVIYLASLVLMLITAFWQINPFTTAIERVWNLDNFRTLLTDGTYRLIILRTIGLAAAVTITDAVLAFPFAYYMARVASRRVQTALFAAVLLPLWASYLARVYAWILVLNHDGLLNWSLQRLHLPPANLGYTNWAMWIVFSYIWLPFMIIPTWSCPSPSQASSPAASSPSR